jgi:hypothetical protein
MTLGGVTPQPWVVTFFAPFAQDSLTNLAPDLGIQGVVPFFTERFTTVRPTNVTCGRVEGPRLQALIDLDLPPKPARALPPTLQLQPAELFAKLTIPVLRRMQHGTLRVAEFEPPSSPSTGERLIAEEAQALADSFVKTQLPAWAAAVRSRGIYTHTTTRTEPSGASATWTNGFVVHYQLQQAGIPVWGDRLSVSIADGRVKQIAGVLHEPAPVTPAKAAARAAVVPLASRAAFNQARPAIESTLGETNLANVVEAELCYTRSADLNPATTNLTEFALTWRFLVEVSVPGSSVYPARKDYWTDATTGRLLGHKAR